MTPAARVAAAIGLLDAVLDGVPAEKALTGWARKNRYAGSGDRAGVRDHVFDALRRRRSYAWSGGAETGRGLMLGAVRTAGRVPAEVFTGERFAPAPLGADDREGRDLAGAPQAVRLDVQDWLLPLLQQSLGADAEAVLLRLRDRAPVFLRVNLRKADVAAARAALKADGIFVQPHPLADTALEVLEGARRVQASAAYRDGLVELQDAASQAVAAGLPIADGVRGLDYCAGGGGKALALAARADLRITAHDADPARMRDLPERARRAGVAIELADTGNLRPDGYDLVLCDAPCSGSGAWRRSPEAKWQLTPERLAELTALQSEILAAAAPLVAPGGTLAYATCSLLDAENRGVIDAFLTKHPDWHLTHERRLTPLDGGDGFYAAHLRRDIGKE